MAISEKDRRALTLGGVALGVIILYFVVIEPLAVGYQSMVSNHATLSAKVDRLVRERHQAESLAAEIHDWEQKAGPLSSPRPYSEQVNRVGEQIIAAAKASGLQFQDAVPGTPVPWIANARLEQVMIQIDAEAEWEPIFRFIAAVYRIDGVLSVEQLDLTGDQKQGGKLKVRLGLSVLAEAAPAGDKRWSR